MLAYHQEMSSIDHDLVLVFGADAGEYLQTQLTQDVLKLKVNDSAWSFLLTAKSEIIALIRVTRSSELEYALEMESGWGDTVRNTIDEFLGRMDVSFSQRTLSGISEGEQSRIDRGWPRMGREIDGSVTPAMTGLVSETIAFDKGCYTGQEFVARVHHRGGEPPKRLVRLSFDPGVSVEVGADIVAHGEPVGTVTSAATGVALGYVKRGTEVPSERSVGDIEVELLPIRPS